MNKKDVFHFKEKNTYKKAKRLKNIGLAVFVINLSQFIAFIILLVIFLGGGILIYALFMDMIIIFILVVCGVVSYMLVSKIFKLSNPQAQKKKKKKRKDTIQF